MIKIELMDPPIIERPFPPPMEWRDSHTNKLTGWVCPICNSHIHYLTTGYLWWKKKIPQDCNHMGMSEYANGRIYWFRKPNADLNDLLERASRSYGTSGTSI
jgi:hypothetical protein